MIKLCKIHSRNGPRGANIFPRDLHLTHDNSSSRQRKEELPQTFKEKLAPQSTACGHRMAHRKWKETKQQSSMLPDSAGPGCSLVSFPFLCYILCSHSLGTWDTSKCSKILRLKDILRTMMSTITEGEKIRRKICDCGTTRISVSSFILFLSSPRA